MILPNSRTLLSVDNCRYNSIGAFIEKKCIFSMSANKDWGCLFLSKYVRGKYYERNKINWINDYLYKELSY